MASSPRTAVARALNYAPGVKSALRRFRLRDAQPQWRDVAGVDQLPEQPEEGEAILIPTSIGSQLEATSLESVLAAALRLRGARVDVLLCDAALPACHGCTLQGIASATRMERDGPRKLLCPGCFESAATMYRELGVNVLRYSDFLDPDARQQAREIAATIPVEEVAEVRLGVIAVGEHAMAGTLRFFARATVDGEPGAERVTRRYLEAAYLTAAATGRLLDERRYSAAVFHHGIYVPQGVIGEVARSRGVRVVNWNPAYRTQRFLFSHGDTYHKTLMSEPVETWSELELSPEQDERLDEYLQSRRSGADDWISFNRTPAAEIEQLAAQIGFDPAQPMIGMLTNVLWDAQLHYAANAFPNMLDWCIETIRWFAGRPDLQLLIRVHPAEVTGLIKSRQLVTDEIARVFPELPPNVFVVGPHDRASTYALMAACDSVIIYGTKTGVELTSIGIPVVVAGEAWIRNKGLTVDAGNKEEYLRLLASLPRGERLDEETVKRARKYAYHFFFRRMIPLEFMESGGPNQSLFHAAVTDLTQLQPGSSRGLDVICDGILHGAPFVYDEEPAPTHAA